MISALNKSTPSGNRFELDFSLGTKAHPLCCALRMLTPPDTAGIAMVARRTPQMNTGDISFPSRVIVVDTAALPAMDSSSSDGRNASGRKLRNRLLLLNAAVWVAVIVAARILFF